MKLLRFITAFIFLFILIVWVSFSGCKKNSSSDPVVLDSISVGVILPMDNANAQLQLNSMKLAFKEVNDAGGVGMGYPLRIELRSSEGYNREEIAVEKAQEILETTNQFVGFTTCYSSSSLGIANLFCKEQGIGAISGCASISLLSNVSDYFERLCPVDEFEAEILVNKAQDLGINNVAIAIQAEEKYCENISNEFQSSFGSEAVEKIYFLKNDAEYDNKLDQLIDDSPDAIMISMLDFENYSEFLEKLNQVSSKIDFSNTYFILCNGLYSEDLFNAQVNNLLGNINGNPKNFGAISYPDINSNDFKYFQSNLLETYNQNVGAFNAQYYDIGYLYALAIEQAFFAANINDIVKFRGMVGSFIRAISRPDPNGDFPVNPSQGWEMMKLAAVKGSLDYSGASGNCNIDNEGNVTTSFKVFTLTDSGSELHFEAIEYLNPVKK
jgi:ABC-type branched-subunit amino acid transport system substrate-binding protein